MSTTEMVWVGPEVLRPFLVQIGDLEPFPGNPRLGDVAAIRESLERFGQLKPIVADGARIVAGHHVVKAAQELGYTHVAVVDNPFGDEDEQRAFLLADNRVADLGPGYDHELLAQHLQALAEIDGLAGTGYTTNDLDGLLADLARLNQFEQEPERVEVTFTATAPGDVKEVVLMFSPAQHERFEAWLKTLAAAQDTSGVSETVYAAVEIAARQFVAQGG